LAVSGFRLRARLGVSIPSSHFGQRGITPAFGYDAPHLSAGGTSTLLIWTLPSAHYDLISLHVADLGGRSNLSEAQLALIKRAATLEVELEQMEGRLSQGEQVDLDVFGRATGNLRRVWEALGLKREPRDITAESDQARVSIPQQAGGFESVSRSKRLWGR